MIKPTLTLIERQNEMRKRMRKPEWHYETDPGRKRCFPSKEERVAVRLFRQRRAWPVRTMAHYCGVRSVQIRSVESADETVEIGRRTMERIRAAVIDGRPLPLDKKPKVAGEPREPQSFLTMDERKAIIRYRLGCRWSMDEMAEHSGLKLMQVERIESADRSVSVKRSTREKVLQFVGYVSPVSAMAMEQIQIPETPAVIDSPTPEPSAVPDKTDTGGMYPEWSF